MLRLRLIAAVACGISMALPITASAADVLADAPYTKGYLAQDDVAKLGDELLFQRAVQTYLWALPALNMYAMKEGSEAKFGKGYNVLPVFKKRLNAKTLITTPNSDVIYALGYLDLKHDGPMVIEVPPGLQGILDDFFQRPIPSESKIDGRQWAGDVGLPGPDKGKGGKYLILPPDYAGDIPDGYLTYRSGTYGVFVFWRGFFTDPQKLDAPVKVIEETKIYPLGQEATAKKMEFPDASGVAVNMLYPQDGTAFGMLSRFIDSEYADPKDFEMRGMAADLGIVKGQPFKPDETMTSMLDRAAKAASRMAHAFAYGPMSTKYYDDRQWINPFPTNANFAAETFNQLDERSSFFTYAYSASPGMALSMENVGAKYPNAFKDADGDYLSGDVSYKLVLPKDIPAKIFWSVTVYDPVTGSGLDNGQPFPSLNTMDKPKQNADGSTDIYFGQTSPGPDKNWIATIPGKGWFTTLRLYGPTKAFFDKTWKPDDIVKIKAH